MISGNRPPEALQHYTGFLLNWVAARSRTAFAAALEQHGLHLREFATLSIVAARPGLTQHELAQASEIDASTLVATLDGLEARGLAERRIAPQDRRKRAIHLTPEGERALTAGRAAAQQIADQSFGALSAAERKRFDALLRKLAGVG
jgi:DNA-binding MarR family transcriptional regulator